MFFNFFQNSFIVIKRWLDAVHLANNPEPVKIRVDQSASAQRMRARRLSRRTSPGQERMLAQKYRR